jgi:hypothetical protein
MAEHDIQVHQRLSNEGSLGFPVTANQTFQAGEPVVLLGTGTLSEAVDDPASVAGIAAHQSTTRTGASFPVGQYVTVYNIKDTIFKTKNFATDGGGTAAVPTVANIADAAGLDFTDGTNWFLDTGQNNLICEVTGVLDISGFSLSDPNVLPGAGVTVLFRFV